MRSFETKRFIYIRQNVIIMNGILDKTILCLFKWSLIVTNITNQVLYISEHFLKYIISANIKYLRLLLITTVLWTFLFFSLYTKKVF